MNAKEAIEIILKFDANPFETMITEKIYSEARGFLDCDAQWKEKVKPLVEALEKISSCACAVNAVAGKCGKCVVCIAKEALSQFRKEMGEE